MKSYFEQLSPGKIAIVVVLWSKPHNLKAIRMLSNWLHDELWLHPIDSPVTDEIELMLSILKHRYISWSK